MQFFGTSVLPVTRFLVWLLRMIFNAILDRLSSYRMSRRLDIRIAFLMWQSAREWLPCIAETSPNSRSAWGTECFMGQERRNICSALRRASFNS